MVPGNDIQMAPVAKWSSILPNSLAVFDVGAVPAKPAGATDPGGIHVWEQDASIVAAAVESELLSSFLIRDAPYSGARKKFGVDAEVREHLQIGCGQGSG